MPPRDGANLAPSLGFKVGPGGSSGKFTLGRNLQGTKVVVPPTGPIDFDVPPPVGGPVLGRGVPAVSEGGRVKGKPKLLSLWPPVSKGEVRAELRAADLPDEVVSKLMRQAEAYSGVRQAVRPPTKRPFSSFDMVDGPEFDEKVALRSDMNASSAAPIDEVGMQMRPDPTAKDPYARGMKEPGKLVPFVKQKKDFDPGVAMDEIVVKGHLSPFMDPHTRIIMEDPEVFPILRKLDKFKGGSARFSATLRTLRGSDPAFVQKALDQMPQARRAWEWTLTTGSDKNPGKFIKNENWLMTADISSKDPSFKLAKEAHDYSLEAYRRGDLMGADLASSAVWSIQNDEVDRARHQMEQAKAWTKERPLSENWLRTFNPRAVERVESQGKALAPVIGGGLDDAPDIGQEDAPKGIFKVVPVEENRPGIARSNFHGQMEAEELPPVKFDGIGRRGKGQPSPDWFKVMRANREIENELLQKGMPRKLAGTAGATRWAAQNAPEVAQLHAMFQSLKAGATGPEVLLKAPPSKAADILDLLLDDAVPPSKGEQWAEGAKALVVAKRGTGGLNVNRVPDDMPLLPGGLGKKAGAVTRAFETADPLPDPRVLEWLEAKMPKALGKLARAILRGV